MPKESSLANLDEFLGQHSNIFAILRVEALCARWGLSERSFADRLRRSAVKRFEHAEPAAGDLESYLRSLHLEDLALACACSNGIEQAWEFFIAHYRQDLRAAAGAMLRASGFGDAARAEELADSLYAELYCVRSKADGPRKSLFEYFHGRSKLSTWLRAVLAQRQVDLIRTCGKTVSLDAALDPHLVGDPPREMENYREEAAVDPAKEKYLIRIDKALSAELAALTPRERMILACYYVDRMTLAEIGRLLGEHESTVSRGLDRIRRALRENVAESLRQGRPARDGRPAEPGLDAAQVELAFEYALDDWAFDLSQALSPREPALEPPEKRSPRDREI